MERKRDKERDREREEIDRGERERESCVEGTLAKDIMAEPISITTLSGMYERH